MGIIQTMVPGVKAQDTKTIDYVLLAVDASGSMCCDNGQEKAVSVIYDLMMKCKKVNKRSDMSIYIMYWDTAASEPVKVDTLQDCMAFVKNPPRGGGTDIAPCVQAFNKFAATPKYRDLRNCAFIILTDGGLYTDNLPKPNVDNKKIFWFVTDIHLVNSGRFNPPWGTVVKYDINDTPMPASWNISK